MPVPDRTLLDGQLVLGMLQGDGVRGAQECALRERPRPSWFPIQVRSKTQTVCCPPHSHLPLPFSAIALTTFNNFLEQLFEFFASAAVPFLYYRVMSKTSFETGPLAIFSMKVCQGTGSA